MATETVMQQQQQQGDHHAQPPPAQQQQKQPANPLKSQISKDLRAKANNFLNSKQYANNLLEIIAHLAQNAAQNESITAVVLTLEVIFTELLKRKDMIVKDDAVEGEEATPESEHSVWLLQHYEETWSLLMKCVEHEKTHEAQQALVTAMKLLIAESKYPLAGLKPNKIPEHRMRSILQSMLSGTKSTLPVIQRFKEYSEYLDVQACCWRLFEQIPTRLDFQNEIYALNFLELLNALPVTNEIQEQGKMLCNSENAIEEKAYKKAQSYLKTRKSINKVWDLVMLWCDGSKEAVHKQTLILLLERIMPHLEKPVLLTDFLMDSLDCGGAISLLALQGVFTLIQKHNITYPNIYEKLYSMFEPEIFHTKFKARLFYLADIFLSSTHLPESLVGAFAKRLARLSLVAPPQDAIIIMYFIGNLILRHNGLKRLICSKVPAKLNSDPYIMEEREPTKSCAMESSLWEIICLQKHAVPSVALAARFISQPLPNKEWDLSSVLEIKEDDIFDQEISRKSKQYAMAFEKPHGLYLAKNDKFKQHWNLF